jgi:small subunit ribosomal protein S7
MIEVRSKRVGGASYQVPMQISAKRQQALSFRWILQTARAKKGQPMAQRLAAEFISAYNKEGGAMTIRENVHRMAEANKISLGNRLLKTTATVCYKNGRGSFSILIFINSV